MSDPKVFVSHASEDKDRFVLGFAQRLRNKAIDAWVDQWEILPGDSLTQKLFYEGLPSAQAVIIVLSKYSVNKPWVREELDQSVVKRINDGTRLIPVVIDDCEVPAPLRHLVWVKIEDVTSYDSEFNRIVQAVYGHSVKPPLGPPPAYVVAPSGPIAELNKIDTLVLKAAGEHFIRTNSRLITIRDLAQKVASLGVDKAQIDESVDVLAHGDYATFKSMGRPTITLTQFGLHEYFRVFYPDYDPTTVRVAALIVNEGMTSSVNIADKLGHPQSVIEHIFNMFESNDLIRQKTVLGAANSVSKVQPRMVRWLNDHTNGKPS